MVRTKKKNTRPCPNVPPEIRQQMLASFKAKETKKMKEIRDGLRDNLKGHQNYDNSESDVEMYLEELTPTERKHFREVMRTSRNTAQVE